MADEYSDLIAAPKTLPTRIENLLPKHQDFIVHYLADPEMNVARAARAAGYAESSASRRGHDILAKPEVQKILATEMRKRAMRTGVDQDAVLRELASVAFGDLRALYNEDGSLKSVHEMDDAAAAMLSGIEQETSRYGITTSKVKRWDKMRAIELLGKQLGMFRDTVEHTGKNGGPIQVEIVQFGETIEGEATVVETV